MMRPHYEAIQIARHVSQDRTGVIVDEPKGGFQAIVNQVHLLQTDNNVQPVMGAVHMVRPSAAMHDKHFMVDMEGDANMGRKRIVDKGRRGPFATSSGRSTVMDRSAHVTYRARRGTFEITVRKHFTEQEMQLLLHKLRSHSASTDAYVSIIKGKSKYRLGKLRQYDLARLRLLVEECTEQYGSCGLEISGQPGTGTLFKPAVHGSSFKNQARRGAGVFS